MVGSSVLIGFRSLELGFFLLFLHSSVEAFASLLECSASSLVSRHGARDVIRVISSVATGVSGNGGEKPPGTRCPSVVRSGDVFSGPSLDFGCLDDIP